MNAMIEVNGRKYIKRYQQFTQTVSITVAGQILNNQALALPGVADFLLEARVRDVVYNNASASNRFRYKEGSTDNAQWYMAAGVGATNDRVIDTNCFGNAMFPFPLCPGIFYSKNASILYEIEDLSQTVPYTIHLGYIGAYLIPVVG